MSEKYTVADIQNTTKDLEAKSEARFSQYLEDERLWRLEKYILQEVSTFAPSRQKDFPSFTSNEPRNLSDLLVGMLTRHPLVPHGDLYEAADETEEDELSAHERFAAGVWRQVDEMRALSEEMPFQSDLAWMKCIRGGSVVRWWLLTEDKDFPFDVQLWDPWDVVWKKGRAGLYYACHHYKASREAMVETWPEAKIGPPDDQGNVEVWDAWWMENGAVWNGVAIAGEWAKEPVDHTKERKLRRIPVAVTRALGAPMNPRVTKTGGGTWLKDRWESIYGPNRDMYGWLNRAMSLYGLVVRDAPLGPIHHQGKAVPNLSEHIGPLRVIQTPGPVKHLDPPQMAGAAEQLVAQIVGAVQRGGAPFSAFGQSPFQLSGVAISQLQGAMELKTTRLSKSMQTDYKTVTDGLIEQYVSKGKKMPLEGVDRRDIPFRREFSAQELKKRYYLRFEHRTDLPIVQMQEANIAEAWARLGVSAVRIYDELLHIQDPNWEYRRKLQEMADQTPLLGALKLAEALDEKRRLAAEAGHADEAAKYAKYRDIILAQVQNTQTQTGQSAPGASLPSPQVAAPENFQQGGSFTPGPQQTPSTEGRLRELGLTPAAG